MVLVRCGGLGPFFTLSKSRMTWLKSGALYDIRFTFRDKSGKVIATKVHKVKPVLPR